MEKKYRCYRRSSSSLAWRKKSIRDWHSSIKMCIIHSLTWSYLGLTVGWWFISGFFRATFLPSSRNKRRDSHEYEIPPNGGTRYRGGGRLPDGEKHRETRYSKILTREIYICTWISLFADDTNACEHGSASTFHFSARKGNLYPCRRNGILIIGMEEREIKKEFAFL